MMRPRFQRSRSLHRRRRLSPPGRPELLRSPLLRQDPLRKIQPFSQLGHLAGHLRQAHSLAILQSYEPRIDEILGVRQPRGDRLEAREVVRLKPGPPRTGPQAEGGKKAFWRSSHERQHQRSVMERVDGASEGHESPTFVHPERHVEDVEDFLIKAVAVTGTEDPVQHLDPADGDARIGVRSGDGTSAQPRRADDLDDSRQHPVDPGPGVQGSLVVHRHVVGIPLGMQKVRLHLLTEEPELLCPVPVPKNGELIVRFHRQNTNRGNWTGGPVAHTFAHASNSLTPGLNVANTEWWQRGPVDGVPSALQPVAHILLQVRESVGEMVMDLTEAEWNARPAGVASAAFHVRHMAGVIDRLFTYARGEALSEAQRAAIPLEGAHLPADEVSTVLETLSARVTSAIDELRGIDPATLGDFRGVGRAQFPSTVMGCLVHGAEHAMRHVGQLSVTVRVVRSGRAE